MVSIKVIEQLGKLLARMPSRWDGHKAILEMRDARYVHWKQMEWIGWYFQFLCDTKLSSLVKIPGPKYGKVEFDGFVEIPWDFKAHPNKSAKGQDNKYVIVNDRRAILSAIKQYGSTGLILAIGMVQGLGSFQKGFRNSDGSSRNAKVLLDLGKIAAIKTIKFS